MVYGFQSIIPSERDWAIIEASEDSTCYHSKKWSDYLRLIGFHVFVLKVFQEQKLIGYFIGEKIWRGVTIVASPYEGIGTYTQGLIMMQDVSFEVRLEIYIALSKWLIDNHISSYFQVDDWQMREESAEWDADKAYLNKRLSESGIRYDIRPTLFVSLNKSVEELWSGLHYKSCKYCINKARKLGLKAIVIDKAEDISEFVDVHYNQLLEVCRRKGVKPKAAQERKRMLALCESLFPDRVLMIKVVGPDEEGVIQNMSSGIFCIDKGECSYWTGASYQRYQKYCPNELMVWEAMRMLSEKGAGDLNFCGMANYKLKFGTIYAYVPRLIFSKYSWLYDAKNLAKRLYHRSRKLLLKNKL